MKAFLRLGRLAAVVIAGIAMSTAATQTARADWQLTNQYTTITSQSATGSGWGGHTNNDGCGADDSASAYTSDMAYATSHVGAKTFFDYTWSGQSIDFSASQIDCIFNVTGTLSGSVSNSWISPMAGEVDG